MSVPSPATGAVTSKRDAEGKAAGREGKAAGKRGKDDDAGRPTGAVSIELQHARNHHLRWVVLGLILGGLCVTQLGTLGQVVGVVLLAILKLVEKRDAALALQPCPQN